MLAHGGIGASIYSWELVKPQIPVVNLTTDDEDDDPEEEA